MFLMDIFILIFGGDYGNFIKWGFDGGGFWEFIYFFFLLLVFLELGLGSYYLDIF